MPSDPAAASLQIFALRAVSARSAAVVVRSVAAHAVIASDSQATTNRHVVGELNMTATKTILLAGLLSLFAASSFAQSPGAPSAPEPRAAAAQHEQHRHHGHRHHHHKHHHHHGHRSQGK
jgi:hypothetical protein